MEIRIYQINPDKDQHRVMFLSFNVLSAFQGTSQPDSSIYDRVFEGTVDCATLEDVYRMFNCNHPEGYSGRNLSVSDIVEVIHNHGPVKSGHYFCDSFGFKKVEWTASVVSGDAVVEGDCNGTAESIALAKQIPQSIYDDELHDVIACPRCHSGEYLFNEDGEPNSFCGQCGQAILWEDE